MTRKHKHSFGAWIGTLGSLATLDDQLARIDLDIDPEEINEFIKELRRVEPVLTRVRKRLEALQDDRPLKTCPVCGTSFAGRADAVYCGSDCRVKAFRATR